MKLNVSMNKNNTKLKQCIASATIGITVQTKIEYFITHSKEVSKRINGI